VHRNWRGVGYGAPYRATGMEYLNSLPSMNPPSRAVLLYIVSCSSSGKHICSGASMEEGGGGGGMANFGRQIAQLVSKEDHEGIA